MILNKVKKVFQVKKSSNKYDKKVPVNICRLIFAKKKLQWKQPKRIPDFTGYCFYFL